MGIKIKLQVNFPVLQSIRYPETVTPKLLQEASESLSIFCLKTVEVQGPDALVIRFLALSE